MYEPVIVGLESDTRTVLTSLPPGEILAPAGPVHRRGPRQAELRDVVSSVWITSVPADAGRLRVLPDAAIDLVFAGGRLVVAGPDTTACLESLPAGRPVLGFQLRPGAVPTALAAPASAVRDQRVDVTDLWGHAGRDLAEAMVEAPRPALAADVLERFLMRRIAGRTPDRLPGAIAVRLGAGGPADLGSLGLGERQLRRRCIASFGYGPRTLARIARFQSTLDLLRNRPAMSLSAVAVAAGYADQAHLAHDVGTFSGLTPRALRSALIS